MTFRMDEVRCKHISRKSCRTLFDGRSNVFLSFAVYEIFAAEMTAAFRMGQGQMYICQSKANICLSINIDNSNVLSFTVYAIVTVEIFMITTLTLELAKVKCKYTNLKSVSNFVLAIAVFALTVTVCEIFTFNLLCSRIFDLQKM